MLPDSSIQSLASRVASPPLQDRSPPKWRRRLRRSSSTIVITISLVTVLMVLLRYQPEYHTAPLKGISPDERARLSKEFLQRGTRLISDIQNAPVWSADFDQNQINAWLTEDFEVNHAEQSLPAGVSQPRIRMEKDTLQLSFRLRKGPISGVIQIGFRAWVPKRNLLAVELQRAWVGALPLPTNSTRQVIEQFAYANNLNVTWKRNHGKLVALFEFPRGHREVVLQKVQIEGTVLHIRGGSSRLPIPTDYAPSAN